jgi:hypothetical protein
MVKKGIPARRLPCARCQKHGTQPGVFSPPQGCPPKEWRYFASNMSLMAVAAYGLPDFVW